MSSQCQSRTPQPTPGHVHNYSQVMDEELVILTNDSTNTEWEKSVEKAKRWKAEEERLRVEQRKRAEEEAQRKRVVEEEAQKKKVAEEEAERQRWRASEERAQARWDETMQR
ncbi:hypothetical protein M404DRAFT_34918 [Pisolithus tinctorius Marx 270]|uniref:Uncharacterized protein n=1 Tax=Pisolithus tinctorius Marx 270 TaxID=870435 RepID=A0A0C3NGG5_PISTI|nr:hypothetical protein M404DRAFT_34918 [Pisolithus tinctorius Marx 270]